MRALAALLSLLTAGCATCRDMTAAQCEQYQHDIEATEKITYLQTYQHRGLTK